MRASTIDDNAAWADLDESDVKVIYTQLLTSHPESIMALVSCIFLRQWSCPGIHPARHTRRPTKPGGRSDRELNE